MSTPLATKMNTFSQRTSSTSSKGGWRSAIFIIFVEVAERFAYYGVAGNLITYLTTILHQPIALAAKNVNLWQGVSAIIPLIGGFLADSYTGRFKTILISSIIYFLGLVLLTTTVTAIPLAQQEAFFFVSLYIISIGEGGHKPCVQTFAADQFDDDQPGAKSSFFNWWYLGIVCAGTSAVLVVIYVEDYISWGIGFGMLTAAVGIALVIFLIGRRNYRRQPPIGSPFTAVGQVLVAAFKKRHLSQRIGNGGFCYYEGDDAKSHRLSRTDQFRFLDNAMIIDEIDARSEKQDKWRLCSITQVEEVKLLLRLIPIWLSCLMFAVVNAQHGTFFTKQGNTMTRLIGPGFQVSAASLQVVTGLTILISLLIYDRVLVPVARNITGCPSGITVLQRIGTGLCTSIATMVVAGIVETKRVSVAKEFGMVDTKGNKVLPMAIWWLVPQYILCGVTDVFTYVGLQELFYDQMPEEMRSMGAAACISVVGIGNFLSSAIISIVQEITRRSGQEWLINNLNRAHLNYFYWVLAGLSFINFCIYVCVAKSFVYKKFQANDAMEEKEIALENL